MKSAQVIQFSADLEEILDTRLFRTRPDEDPQSVDDAKSVKGAVLAGGLAVGGAVGANAAKRYANSAGVNDRLSGMRSTVPGFAQKSPGLQRAMATASRAGSDVASGVSTAAKAVGKEAAYVGRGLYNSAENAGIGALRKSKPLARNLLGRIGALATKIK
jgi:hypothetical protein